MGLGMRFNLFKRMTCEPVAPGADEGALGIAMLRAPSPESAECPALADPAVADPAVADPSVADPAATNPAAASGPAAHSAAENDEPVSSFAPGKPCPHCGSTEPWGLSSWCPNCFYYPKLSSQIEAGSADDFDDGSASDEPLGFDSVPTWARILAGGCVVIFGVTVAAAVLLPDDDPLRSAWTLAQLTIGVVAAVAAHAMVFFTAIPDTDRYGPFDIVFRPIEVWRPMVHHLPKHAWRLWQVAWGLTAAVWAVTLIGGVRYSAMFEDWGFEKRVRTNIAPAVVTKARTQERQADSFSQAMQKTTQAPTVYASPPKAKSAEIPMPVRKAQCVIVGYVKNSDNALSSILLGSMVDGRLTYVGSVPAADLPEAVRTRLQNTLPRLEQAKAAVRTLRSATWIKPVVKCNVSYHELTPGKTFKKPKVDQLIDEAGSEPDQSNSGGTNP